jgi:hypothetical protein
MNWRIVKVVKPRKDRHPAAAAKDIISDGTDRNVKSRKVTQQATAPSA